MTRRLQPVTTSGDAWPSAPDIRAAIDLLRRVANLEYWARHGDVATRERAKLELEELR